MQRIVPLLYNPESCFEFRAKRLEKLLQTPARIYFKYEGSSPAGSHKPNTAVPQAYYNAKEGVKNVVTETGAGQWGSSLAFASSLFGLDCEVNTKILQLCLAFLSSISFVKCLFLLCYIGVASGQFIPSKAIPPVNDANVGSKGSSISV